MFWLLVMANWFNICMNAVLVAYAEIYTLFIIIVQCKYLRTNHFNKGLTSGEHADHCIKRASLNPIFFNASHV